MPFQVSFSNARLGPPPVILISAGENQSVFCGTVVTLEAIVDEIDNIVGHTLEWEQLSGNPVLLSCPTCLTTTYPLTDLTEKIFRFWIDKGIPNLEQYADVTIFHTPTSDYASFAYVAFDGSDSAHYVPASSPPCDSIIITLVEPPLFESEEVPGALGLEWDIVEQVDLRPFVTQYTVLEDSIPVATVLVGEERKYTPTIPAVYQILTEFVVNGQYSSELSCEKDFTGDLYPNIVVIDDTFASFAFGGFKGDDIAIVKYTNEVVADPESEFASFAFNGFAGDNVEIVAFGNIVVFEPESEYASFAFNGFKGDGVSITRFDSGSIGG